MRKAKFRAWDEEMNQMYCGDQIESESNLDAWLSYGEIAIYRIDNGDYTELKPLQCTGLEDMNGVEIYEGDLLKGYDPESMEIICPSMGVYWSNRGMWDCESFILGGMNERCEVIGNKYEHPHLLESEGRP